MSEHELAKEDTPEMITRREAILRVSVLLGGVALVGGSALITGCREKNTDAPFTTDEVGFLDEVADTILPPTSTPGAKAAKTGAFMALMVTDSYSPSDRQAFRDGMQKVDDASRKAYSVSFVKATPQQRLALLEVLDREQKAESDARKAKEIKKVEAFLADQRAQAAPGPDVNPAAAIAAEKPAHYFRMMKELALLGYFTSEIGCTQAQRYVEAPGHYDPCVPYHTGDKAMAAHA
ncbi:MAG: gluconate 2-dehydrogenase subunit 3 family protein [Gemmatimonadaceae bacterium]